ncbi:transcriptional adapter 2-alpha [Asbolus verrucosus]|uniref:DNA-directed RNA polymerase II subunit RPB4 n=3 Tax=Cucujiformia TaxID=41088 RepID=A0A482W301_ASBVE|nr:transcriptional adapter 2-alpha [Asbolus verrucosus]
MANTNTDLTEEDAADLQFPKGVELQSHKNYHDYCIIRDDFPLFDGTDWTAKEELILLNSIQKYGNWNLVNKELPNRTMKEIKTHYDYFYLERRGSNQLPAIRETETSVFLEPIVPYRCRINDADEPPRYSPNTVGYKSLAGYNPARSDFECEFDPNAEDLLSNLKSIDRDDPHYDLITNLQCAVISSYNRRLVERQRWKRIIRNHGLIVLRKVYAWLHRYDVTITRPVYEKLIRFMQYCTAAQFEMLLEGLHRSGELKIQILRLCQLRQKGITSLADARLYLKLKQTHEQCENELKSFHANAQLNWKMNNRNFSVDLPFIKKKSGFTPIEIIGMPGYEKLTPSERELCRNVRLVPITYLELKEVLIAENKKMGSIKLKTARKILKIDFENAETLLISEVHMLLEHRKAQNESAEDEQEFSDVFMKTLTYTDRFRKFKNKETISAVRNLLMQKKLHKFELAAIANLCPETTEEAKSLIPSLEGRFEDEELQAVLDDIQTKRSIQY